MTNYLHEYSAGDVFRTTWQIYSRNLKTFLLIYCIPIVPVQIWDSYMAKDSVLGYSPWSLVTLIVTLFPWMATVIAVSDVCLGNAPGFARSYRGLLQRRPLVALGTQLLAYLAIAAGFVALVVPGLFVMAWFMFTAEVAVLERRYGIAALKRGRELGRGWYVRNLTIFFALFVTFFLYVVIMLGLILALLSHLFAIDENHMAYLVIASVLISLAAPLFVIGSVLLYYDMRVRKESYDAMALAEDMRR